MAQEEIKYTIPADDQGDNGSLVDLVVTYNPSDTNADGSYTITGASGTYKTLDVAGNVVDSDNITGLGSLGGQDQHLFISSNPSVTPIVDLNGIAFTIDNDADSNDQNGNVNLFDNGGPSDGSAPTDTPDYFEDGLNTDTTTSMTERAVCFASETWIRTFQGNVPVEMLAIGNLVVTAHGEHRPIRWLGHRTIDCRRHPRPHAIMPVRIAAHAFGDNQPARDLLVSPGHAICVDMMGEVLIPASALVNGTTIAQIEVPSVTYWHVELDSHDVILAENLPAESYLEMGNRGFFVEADKVTLHARPDAPIATHADFCRPFLNNGPIVEAVRAVLGRIATGDRSVEKTRVA